MQDIPFWKAIVVTIAIIILALAYMYVASMFGFNDPWVAFVAVTLWGAMGMKMEDAPGIFLGGALGLLLSLSIELLPDLYGDLAAILPLCLIILAISCKIKGMLPLFCNFGLFMFLTIGSADIFLDQRLQLAYLQDLAFGAVCFWILPWLYLKLKPRVEAEPDGG